MCPASQDGGEKPRAVDRPGSYFGTWAEGQASPVLSHHQLPLPSTDGMGSSRRLQTSIKDGRKPKVAHLSPSSRYLPWVRYCDVEMVDLGLLGAPARRLRSPSIWCSRYTPDTRQSLQPCAVLARGCCVKGPASSTLLSSGITRTLPVFLERHVMLRVAGSDALFSQNSSARSSASHAQVSRGPA